MSEALVAELTAKLRKRLERAKKPVPVGVSSRHFHVSREHWETLFGKGAEPSRFRDVKQPGFWAANETVALVGPKGRLESVRLVAPYRDRTQIEVSGTDAARLGVSPPVRDSGDVKGSAPLRLVGPKGEVELREGAILAKRHIHFHPDEAREFGLKDGELVRVRAGIGGPRELVFEQVLVRVSERFSLEFHVDTDEANAAGIKTGDSVVIV